MSTGREAPEHAVEQPDRGVATPALAVPFRPHTVDHLGAGSPRCEQIDDDLRWVL